MSRNNVRRFVSFRDYLVLFSNSSEEVRKEQVEAAKMLPRPLMVCGKVAPDNLNLISYGQLDDLHDHPNGVEAVINCCRIILGAEESAVMNERADRILWFTNFCNSEVKRINTLFSSIQADYEPEEKMAGIEKLKFGSFGVLDWYSRRMGISDQNAVRDIPWIRIYQCMKNDNEQSRYERRLREVYKRRNKKR